MRPIKIMSGGQTGVDRAALDVALELGIPHGGWCPLGRRAEDGRIPDRYQLSEMPGASYASRTRRNIWRSDRTLLLVCSEEWTPGTLLTYRSAMAMRKPVLAVDLRGDTEPNVPRVREWVSDLCVNVAGPRESKFPGIYDKAQAFLRMVLA